MATGAERVVAIVRALADHPLTTAQLAKQFGVDRSTVTRNLQVLEREGFVRRRSDSTYALGFGLLGLAHGGFDQVELRKAAYVPLRQLQQITGTTVHLAQLDGTTLTYIDKAESLDGVGLYARIGQPLPAYCTAVGKAVLAHVPDAWFQSIVNEKEWIRYTEHTLPNAECLKREIAEIRRRGWAIDDCELDELVNCVAVPVIGGEGLLGAISLTSLSSVANLEELARHVPIMQRMATTVQRRLPPMTASAPKVRRLAR